jgi:hypothetical protein
LVIRAKSKKRKDQQRRLTYYKIKTLEEQLAQNYCHKHSIKTTHNKNSGEIKETIFIGTPNELAASVLAEITTLRKGTTPDYPQGLVIHDSKGTGAFD